MQHDDDDARDHEPFQQIPRGANQHVAAAVDRGRIAKKLHQGHRKHFPAKRKPFRRSYTVVQGPELSCPAKAGHPVTTGHGFSIKVRWLLDRPLSRTMTLERSSTIVDLPACS